MTTSQHMLDHGLSSDIADFIRGPKGHDIGDLIDRLSPVGDCAIFGGLPRDFARDGRNSFRSDVDVVVDAAPGALDALLGQLGGERNRFGGYRLRYGRFDFDVWALQTTWAASNDYVTVHSLTDLVKTTFFDCDAVLFHCRTLEITRSEQFWPSIEHGIVDINLEANPHYIGTLARTLRILFDWQQQLTPRLANYLAEGIARSRNEILDYATRNGAGLGLASGTDLDAAISALYTHGVGKTLLECKSVSTARLPTPALASHPEGPLCKRGRPAFEIPDTNPCNWS
ncbi:hypothetical protein JQK88_16995 [Mesorhizobium caraganae]|uniref:hypothetical protein n=1 Tax=Mesorhizobium caraganae TaxID=483206 RepID=UPI00193A9F26|nr:hypothetical protein [Mesorhizobium caraganae]MBM2712880.1 hypothetical protein [Mesorhizobium caraganae]